MTFLLHLGWRRRRRDILNATFRRLEGLLQHRFQPRNLGEGIYDYVKRLPLKPELRFPLMRFLQEYHRFYFAGGAPDPKGKSCLVRDGKSLLRQMKAGG